jgi:hypothetical protein
MSSRVVPAWRNSIVCGILLLLWSLSASRAFAQSVESDAVSQKLSKKVQIHTGNTTLEKVAASLSEQTDLKIEPADYLGDREMIVRIDGMSGRAVLNALCELNDWTWKETPDHTISILRHLLQLPRTPAAIPRIVQSAVPKDTRTFLRIPTPREDLHVYTNPLLTKVGSLNDWRKTTTLRFLKDTQADLFSTLPPNAVKGDPLPFDKLTNQQRRDLIVQIAFRQLATLDEYVLSDFLPYVADPSSARLEKKGKTFMVGFRMRPDSWTGFSTDVVP